MYTRNVILSILLPFLFLACGGGSGETSGSATGTTLTATLADSGETHPLRDDLQYLGTVMHAISAGENRLVVADNTPSVSLFENHVMTRTFGEEGEGPCEYGGLSSMAGVTAMDTSGDSLFVLVNSQQKIITFDLSTGECLGETNHPDLVRRQYLARVGGGFLTGLTQYTSNAPDTTRMLSLLRDDETMIPLDLEYGDIDAAPSPMSIALPGGNFARNGNHVYTIFPFSQQVTVVDIPTHNVSMLPLDLDANWELFDDLEVGSSINSINFEKFNEILLQVELLHRVFAADDWIAISTTQPREGGSGRRIHFRNHRGEPLSTMEPDGNAMAVHGDRLIFFEQSEDPESEYTYRVTYRRVTLE